MQVESSDPSKPLVRVVEMQRPRDTRLGCEVAVEILRRTIQRSHGRRGPCGGCTEARNFCTLYDVGTNLVKVPQTYPLKHREPSACGKVNGR